MASPDKRQAVLSNVVNVSWIATLLW
jgi:hypothetical protein